MEFIRDESLIRSRINDNLLKVEKESEQVKSLLSLAVNSAKPRHDDNSLSDIYQDIDLYARYTNRKDLLRTAIILGTSRNNIAQENLIAVVRTRLGKITDKDYKYIANILSNKNPKIVEHINDFLSFYLPGYSELHQKYYKKYYGI